MVVMESYGSMHAVSGTRDESPTDSSQRERSQAHARQVSFQIDSDLKAERLAMKKGKKPVKVLLLGQSESGKTTIIKSESITLNSTNATKIVTLMETSRWRMPMMLLSKSGQHGRQSSG